MTSPRPVPPGPPLPNGPLARYLLDPAGTTRRVFHHALHTALHVVVPTAAVLAAVVAAVVVVGLLAAGLVRRWRHDRLCRGARMLHVLGPPVVESAGAEVLWANLHDLLRPRWRRLLGGQPHLAFELRWADGELHVGFWVPGMVPPGLAERAIEAAWPGAQITVADAGDLVPDEGQVSGGALRLARGEWHPLRSDHPVDPLRAVLGAASGLPPGWAAAVQVLARPVGARRQARARRRAVRVEQHTPRQRRSRLRRGVLAAPAASRLEQAELAEQRHEVVRKLAGLGWEVALRYGVATSEQGHDARRARRGRAHALASSFAVFSGANWLRRSRLRHPAQRLAQRRLGRADLVSVAELAALAHLPVDATVPGWTRAGTRTVPPPPRVPTAGKLVGDADGLPGRPIAVHPADGRYHLHVLGATGTGKSTLLLNLILGDVAAGRGTVVVDPKGDLIVDVLERLPAEAVARTILIDPDGGAPPALNVLEGPDPELVVDHLVGIFHRIFEAYWGPRTDDILRAACLTLTRTAGSTLADVPRLLAEEHFRRRHIAGLDDPVGLGGFWRWYEELSPTEQARVVGPIMNKLRAFFLRTFVRRILDQPTSSFDMARDVLDGGVLLVRVPKGIVGDDTARLIGSLIMARVWQAATARARAGEASRHDAAVYLDECQNFLTLPNSVEDMLAEARGFRLGMILAHQHLGQLPADLRRALAANARNKIIFSVSPEDAATLERHVAPELSAHDLSHLAAYQAAARLVVDGAELPAFTVRTRPAPPPGSAASVRVALAVRHGPRAGSDGAATRLHGALDPKLLAKNGRHHAARRPDQPLDRPPGQSPERP